MSNDRIVLFDETQNKLSEILADGVDVHRCAAASALGIIGAPGASEALKAALLDEDEDVRSDAMAALDKLAVPSTAQAIMENFLGDPCTDVKLAAISTLTKLRYQPLVPHLLKLVIARSDDIVWDEDAFYEGGWDDWLDIQLAAIIALADLGVMEAVPAILEALDDEMGQDVSATAIPALAKLGEAGWLALDQILADGDTRMRRRICDCLQPGTSAAADNALQKCLNDPDTEIREIAVGKLLGHSPEDDRLDRFFKDVSADIRTLVVSAIGKYNQAATMTCLTDNSATVRQAAFRCVTARPARFEKDDFAEIFASAIGGDPEVAGEAAVAWAAINGPDSAPSLGEILIDADHPLPFRLGVIKALALLEEPGLPHLAKAAGDADRQVRLNALTAIGEISKKLPWPNPAGEILLTALDGLLVDAPAITEPGEADEEADETAEPEPGLETAAAVEIESAGDLSAATEAPEDEAVSTLDQMMNKGLRTEAVPDEDQSSPEIELDDRDNHFIELAKKRRMAKSKISLDVKVAPHLDVRRFAARLFSELSGPGIVIALGKTLLVDDDELKFAALDSLACVGETEKGLDESLGEPLLACLEVEDENVRRLAIRCLGWLNCEKTDRAIVKQTDDADVHIRQEAMRALGHRGGDQLVLITALQDAYSGVRITAARALAAHPDAGTIQHLVNLTLGHDGMHRSDVVEMLISLDPGAASRAYLNALGDDTRKPVWRVAIEALGGLLTPPNDDKVSLAA